MHNVYQIYMYISIFLVHFKLGCLKLNPSMSECMRFTNLNVQHHSVNSVLLFANQDANLQVINI